VDPVGVLYSLLHRSELIPTPRFMRSAPPWKVSRPACTADIRFRARNRSVRILHL